MKSMIAIGQGAICLVVSITLGYLGYHAARDVCGFYWLGSGITFFTGMVCLDEAARLAKN